MDRNRNLLMAVAAIRSGLVGRAEFVNAVGRTTDLGEIDIPAQLALAGVISERGGRLLAELAEGLIRKHGGGTKEAFMALDGPALLEELSEKGGAGATPDSARYSGEREISRGGMGRVLLARDERIGREVALKEMLHTAEEGLSEAETLTGPAPSALGNRRRARFLQEARIAGQLEHPSIVPVHELGFREDGTPYYTMRLVRGRTLASALESAEGLRERLKLLPHFVDLCQAIAYAHSRGVIHRDVKPLNVMVGPFGETILLDWGIAKARKGEAHSPHRIEPAVELGAEAQAVKTMDGRFIGTALYAAPEQVLGELDRVDERSDIYGLGAVLYELLTGEPPFSGTEEAMDRVVNAPLPPVLSLEPAAPPELAAICERALEKEPERRYQTAEALRDEVERFLSGALVRAYTYRFSDHLIRFVKRNKALLAVIALSAFTLLALAGYSYMRVRRERDTALALLEKMELTKQARKDEVRKESEPVLTDIRATIRVEPFELYPPDLLEPEQAAGLAEDLREALQTTGRFETAGGPGAADLLIRCALRTNEEGIRFSAEMSDVISGSAILEPATLSGPKDLFFIQGELIPALAQEIATAYPFAQGRVTEVTDEAIVIDAGSEAGLIPHVAMVAMELDEAGGAGPVKEGPSASMRVVSDALLVRSVRANSAEVVFRAGHESERDRIEPGMLVITK